MLEKNLPFDYQEYRVDYGSRTDGQPDYQGYGAPGLSESANGWTILKSTYDTNDYLTKKQVKVKGVWDSRSSYFA